MVFRIAGCSLLAWLLTLLAVMPARSQSTGVVVLPAGGRHVAGVVIVDPGAQGPAPRSRAMARQLVHAGYATLIVATDPLAGAAMIKRQASVRGDDIAVIGYGAGASAVLAAIVERYDLDVAHLPVFRSAVAYAPDCSRSYGDWAGHSLANRAGAGSTGAPHANDVATAGLYRTATPLVIVGGAQACRDLARDSFVHEYWVKYTSDDTSPVRDFIADNAQYSIVTFASSEPGVTLIGELDMPASKTALPATIISPGTAGIEGFPFWERPWARRLHDLGYASLIVDSYMTRHSAWKNHWRIDARTTRARDLLDAAAYLSRAPFVRTKSLGAIGRSSGGTAILAAIVTDSHAPATPPPFPLDVRPPFAYAVADYGYCQLGYGDWPGGTPSPGADAAYRTKVPLLIQVGAQDQTVQASACEALAAGAQAVGVPLELHVYPDAIHRFDAGAPGVQAGTIQASIDRITSFIQAHSAL